MQPEHQQRQPEERGNEPVHISTPLRDLLAQVDEARRTALLAEVNSALHPFVDSNGLAFPIESQIIMARR